MLTREERMVLAGLLNDLSSGEIAERVGIPVEAVKEHRKSAIKRLGANSTLHAISIAVQAGLIERWEPAPPAPDSRPA